MKTFFSGLAVFATVVLTGTSTVWAAQIERRNSEVHITGYIEAGDDKLFEKTLEETTKQVEIKSHGGARSAALRIAFMIQQRDLAVRVREVCTDECADLIFSASRHRSTGPDAVLGFTGASVAAATAEYIAAWRRFCDTYDTPECMKMASSMEKYLLSFDSLTVQLHQALGRDRLFMDREIALITRPPREGLRMYVNVADGEPGIIMRTKLLAKCHYWVPDNAGLVSFGVALENGQRYELPQSAGLIREQLGLSGDDYYAGDLFDLAAIQRKCGISLRITPEGAEEVE